jgi:YTH domain-containing family protein
MSSPASLSVQPPSPSPPRSSPISGGVRRYHTISDSSRGARAIAKGHLPEEDRSARTIIKDPPADEDQPEPDQEHWKDDEPVDQDWVGGVGAVGEKSLLHRQSSLPTKYHRGKPIHSPFFTRFSLMIRSACSRQAQREFDT